MHGVWRSSDRTLVKGIEERTDVGVEHPVHLLRHDPDRQRIQRLVRTAPLSESVGEAEEVRSVDRVQHLDDGALSGLCRPSAFGMYALRTGFARYAPRFSLSARSRRLASKSSP